MPENSASTRQPESRSPENGQWTVVSWPLRDQPLVSGLWAGLFLVIAAVAAVASGNVFVGIFAFVSLVLASWRRWVPVTFVVGPQGVTEVIGYWQRRIAWHQFSRCEARRRGVLLLTTPERTPLAPLSGLFIRTSEPDRLLPQIDLYLQRARAGSTAHRARSNEAAK